MQMWFIIILASISIAGMCVYVFPYLAKHFDSWQKKRVEHSTQVFKRMFIEISERRLYLIFMFSPILASVLAGVIFQKLIAVVCGLLAGLLLPSIIIVNLDRSRRKKFAQQFTDALLMFSSSLRAGLSLLQAIETVATEMSPPLGQEFGLILKENKMGVGLEESFHRLAHRMDMEELSLFTTAILLARETGGDLSILVSRIVNTIRERNKIISQIKTLTLQGRWQGMIMSVLPFIFGFFVIKTNPKFFEVMFKDQLGRMLLFGAAVALVIGIFLIQRLSRIEI